MALFEQREQIHYKRHQQSLTCKRTQKTGLEINKNSFFFDFDFDFGEVNIQFSY